MWQPTELSEPSPILHALAQAAQVRGALVETVDAQALEIVWPSEDAKRLETGEYMTVTVDPEAGALADSTFVTYGSDLLQGVEALLEEQGRLAYVERDVVQGGKSSGFDQAIDQAFCVHNGRMRVVETRRALTLYGLAVVEVEAEADEKRLSQVSIAFNALTGVAPIDLGNALTFDTELQAKRFVPDRHSIASIALEQTVARATETMARQTLRPWLAHLERKLRRDEQRLRDYYATMATEIQKRAARKRHGHDTRPPEDTAKRIQATYRELDRKLLDTRERYRVAVRPRLRSLLLIGLPTVHVICELQRKKIKRHVTAVYNPCSRRVEPLLCSQSLQPTYSFALSNEDAAIIGPRADSGYT